MARQTGDRGIALIGVVLVLTMLMGLAAALATAMNSDTQLRGAFGRGITGLYAAESGLNSGMGEFKNKFLNFGVPNGSDFDARSFTLGDRSVTYQLSERAGNPQSLVIPSGELFGGLNSLQYTYTVSSKAGVDQDIEAEVGAEFNVSYIPLFQFVAFYIPDLEVLPGPEMHLHGRIHANEDLYLNAENKLFIEDNPANGIATVQISTAGDIYRGRKNDPTQCKGEVTIDKLEDVVAPSGDLDPKLMACSGGTRLVPQAELAQWKGSIISNISSISVPEPDIIQRGGGEFWQRADLRIVLNLQPTVPGGLPGGQVVPYRIEVQDAAGLADEAKTAILYQFMTDNAFNAATSSMRGTMPVFYSDVPLVGVIGGVNCTCSDANPVACTHNNANCYNPGFRDGGTAAGGLSNARVFRSSGPDLDYRRGGFYNWRERQWMLLLNVNIRDLLAWNAAHGNPFFNNGDTTDGGLVVFLSVEGPNANIQNNYGVRIFGSANLPLPGGIGVSPDPTGITVVTDQALYLIGDYNRGPVIAGDLPKQPAAMIGDSVNVLSNNYWDGVNNCTDGCACAGTLKNDCQSIQSLGAASRVGTATRVNAAFLSGVDETTVGNYNGGLENYPRFHESWSGNALTYNGSFVSLGHPQHVNGAWCGTGGSIGGGVVSGCNIYNPPVRNWDYDPAFNNAANLPPLTPRFVYVQQVLFTESFK